MDKQRHRQIMDMVADILYEPLERREAVLRKVAGEDTALYREGLSSPDHHLYATSLPSSGRHQCHHPGVSQNLRVARSYSFAAS